jgi:hypothetical protein
VTAFSPIEFVELDVTNTFNRSIATPMMAHYDANFFKIGADAAGLSSGADFTLLSLQPLPEPSAMLAIGGGLLLFGKRDRAAVAG